MTSDAALETPLILKGRGGANAVFEYPEKLLNGSKCVIRIRVGNGAQNDLPENAAEQALSAEVWKAEFSKSGEHLQTLEFDIFYIRHVMSPLIGHQYISQQVRYYINRRVIVTIIFYPALVVRSLP